MEDYNFFSKFLDNFDEEEATKIVRAAIKRRNEQEVTLMLRTYVELLLPQDIIKATMGKMEKQVKSKDELRLIRQKAYNVLAKCLRILLTILIEQHQGVIAEDEGIIQAKKIVENGDFPDII